VRDRISLDTWRVVNQIDRILLSEEQDLKDPTTILSTLDRAIIPLAAFAGLTNESMTHGHGWRFLDMGRRVERAVNSVLLLTELVVESVKDETALLDALLTIAASQMTYRSRYRTSISAMPVIDLLLLDESNPRSVAFQLARLEDHILDLPHDTDEGQRSEDERMILAMLASLRLADVDELVLAGPNAHRELLQSLLASLEVRLPELSDVLIRRYLTHAQTTQSLAPYIEVPIVGEEATI